MALAHAFYSDIMRALAESDLAELLNREEAPVTVLGPGTLVEITFEIDQSRESRWQQLVLLPTEEEPPVWSARLQGPEDTGNITSPEGMQLPDALAHVASAIPTGTPASG